ncbi:MAG: glycoside hydrolase family 43 protein [Candidatus Sumerlaeaceae bacterium]
MRFISFSLRVRRHVAGFFVVAFMQGLIFAAKARNEEGSGTTSTVSSVAYTNPVYRGSMPDPSVIRHGGWYYAYGTTGNARTEDGRIFTTLRSRDLVNWEKPGGALVSPSPDRHFQYWAPEVTEFKGKFYLYYSMGKAEEEKFELRVAASDRPDGPFTDLARLTDCENNRFTIDAFPFQDTDGQWYLFYARNFTKSAPGVHPGTALVVDRLLDMTRLAGECQVVVRARYDWTLYEANRRMDVYDATFDWHTIEGPCVVKRDGQYYCFYSGANYKTTRYGVDYVVADKPMGPYRDQGDHARVLSGIPDKVRGPGHHSIVTGPDNKTDYLVYHAWDPAMKVRWMCVDELKWTSEGPHCQPTFTTQTCRYGNEGAPGPPLSEYKVVPGTGSIPY